MPRKLVLGALAVIVVVGAMLAYFIFWVAPYASFQDKSIGASVSVSGAKVPKTIHAQSIPIKAGWTPFTSTQPIVPPVDVTPSGSLPGQIVLRIKLSRRATLDDVIVIATSETLTGPWTLLQPSISRDGWYASFRVSHLSIFDALFFSLKAAVQAFKTDFIDGITGALLTQATPPTCANQDQARQGDYIITSSAKNTVYWCAGVEDGTRVLKVVSRVLYPLEISTRYLAIRRFTGPRFGHLNSIGGEDVLYAYDEVDYAVSDLNVGQTAMLDTRYSGLAQSVYRLQIGVTTLLSILTWFGAGVVGTGVGGSRTAFDVAVEYMSTLLTIGTCANAFKQTPGAVVSGCLSPAQVLEAFGWKGLLLAPIMAVSGLLQYFESEMEGFIDLLRGADQYQVTFENAGALAAFVGGWHVHGYQMTINADGTGEQNWNEGSCYDPNIVPDGPFCTGYDDIAFTANADGTITGTITKVWYTQWDGTPMPADYNPGPGSTAVGDVFNLRMVNPQLLITTWINPAAYNGGGNPYWCGSQYSGPECGA